jgi:DNA-binding winged helix-turn-helix (wHTH) protein/TolB-like protein
MDADATPGFVVFGHFEWQPARRRLLVDGKPAPLGSRALDVLAVLVEQRDRVVGKNELMALVWPDVVVEENNLQVQVSALRKVLGSDTISTIPGRGYRFTPQADVVMMAPTRRDEPSLASSSCEPETEPSASLDETALAIGRTPPARAPARATALVGRKRALTTLLVALIVTAAVAGVLSLRARGVLRPHVPSDTISLAVKPFAVSGAEGEAELAQSLNRSLVAALTRWPRATVTVAATSASQAAHAERAPPVRYAIEGNVARRGPSVVVTAGLVDQAAGRQTWAGEFQIDSAAGVDERELLAARLVRGVRKGLAEAFYQQALAEPEGTALGQWARGTAAWGMNENTGWRDARSYFDRALTLEPNHPLALIAHGWTLVREIDQARSIDPALVGRLDRASARAVEAAPNEEFAWSLRCWALLYQRRWGEAFAAAEIAIERAPYHPEMLAQQGNLLQLTGRQAEAEAVLLRAIAIEPPGSPFILRTLCGTRLLLGRYDEAAQDCERAAARAHWFEDQMLLAAIYAHRGDIARAEVARREMLKHQPETTLANNMYLRISDEPSFRRQVEEHLLTGLRKAGVPER